jgi:hypothetical protein
MIEFEKFEMKIQNVCLKDLDFAIEIVSNLK